MPTMYIYKNSAEAGGQNLSGTGRRRAESRHALLQAKEEVGELFAPLPLQSHFFLLCSHHLVRRSPVKK